MPYEQNTCSKIALGYVRTLTQREELPLLRDHLLRLDAEELAKLPVTAPFVAARTVKNLNGAYWMLLFFAWLDQAEAADAPPTARGQGSQPDKLRLSSARLFCRT